MLITRNGGVLGSRLRLPLASPLTRTRVESLSGLISRREPGIVRIMPALNKEYAVGPKSFSANPYSYQNYLSHIFRHYIVFPN